MNKKLDSKTLADVQPGGRVRLGDALPPLPPMGYEERGTSMGPHDVYYTPVAYTAEQMRDYARAALSAQPSPGGRDSRSQFEAWAKSQNYDMHQSAGGPTFVVGEYTSELTAGAWEAWQHLAARQPVTMDDALAAGDGTLHGAIDHWQERALRAEAELAARQPEVK